MAKKTEQQKAWTKIVGTAWAGEVCKQCLLNNPAAVSAEQSARGRGGRGCHATQS